MADDELVAMRREMDALNTELRDLLQARARLARRIGEHKASRGLPGADPQREAEMLAALLAAPPEGFAPEVLEGLLRRVFEASRAVAVAVRPGGS